MSTNPTQIKARRRAILQALQLLDLTTAGIWAELKLLRRWQRRKR